MAIERLQYGALTFSIISSNEWRKEAVFDDTDTDYEYTRHLIDVNLIFNPAEGAFALPGLIPGGFDRAPVDARALDPSGLGAAAGTVSMPAQTENAIKNYLEGQRRQLTITSGNTILLQSPGMDNTQSPPVPLPCDAANGPYVRVRAIRHNLGTRLWLVRAVFETYTNDTPFWTPPAVYNTGVKPPPVLLSHRWNVTHDVDGVTRLTVRTVNGTAVFNAAELARQNLVADDLRYQLLAHCPDYFYRDNIKVNVEADGNTVRYSYTDRERSYSIRSDSPARQIKLYDTGWVSQGGVGHAVAQAMPEVGGFWRRYFGEAVQGNWLSSIGEFFGFAGRAANIVRDNLPKYHRRVTCEVWGGRDTSAQSLVTLAIALAINRMNQNDQAFVLFSNRMQEFNILIARHDAYARVEIANRWGLEDDLMGSIGTFPTSLVNPQTAPRGALGFIHDLIEGPDDTRRADNQGVPHLSRANLRVNPSLGGDTALQQHRVFLTLSGLSETDVAAVYTVFIDGRSYGFTTSAGSTFGNVASGLLASMTAAGLPATVTNAGLAGGGTAIQLVGPADGSLLHVFVNQSFPTLTSRFDVVTLDQASKALVGADDRGTYLKRIVTQALNTINHAPAATPQAEL